MRVSMDQTPTPMTAVTAATNASGGVRSVPIIRIRDGSASAINDDVAVEEPLEIRVEGHTLSIVMRTPGHDRELAAGYLLAEGIIRSARDLFDVSQCGVGMESIVDVALRDPSQYQPEAFARNVWTSSSCGLCGTTVIGDILRKRRPLRDTMSVPAELLYGLPKAWKDAQPGFHRTGGLHACALFDSRGTLESIREDVGRHNALDKLIGHAVFSKSVPLKQRILLLSGRISFEMVQKAHAARIPIVAGLGAPTSLAVDFARKAKMTLAGFLKDSGMNVYSGAERITG